MARTYGVVGVVGISAVDGPSGWCVLHQCGAHLCGSEWPEWYIGRCRRGVFTACGRLGPDFQRLRTGGGLPAAFVAIRLVAGDRQTGALKLELQHPMSAFTRMTAKSLVLFFGWVIALLAPTAGVLLWKSYGGTIFWPELAAVVFGHLLNAGLTIALAC